MITAPENNIKLTDGQTASIEEAQRRLSVIETQIIVQSKNLRIAKTDTENATRDRLLLEEEVKKLSEQLVPLKEEISKLSEQKYELITDLSMVRTELSEIKNASDRKMSEIAEQVKIHGVKEADLAIRELSLAKAESEQAENKKIFYQKVARINEAING